MSAVLQHLSSFDSYIRHGWKLVPIAPNTKGPTSFNWNHPDNAMKLGDVLPEGWGVGLMHSLSGTCAVDVDNWTAAELWFKDRGIDLKPFFTAGNSVGIDSGNPGHAKLVFSLPFPLPSKKVVIGKETIFEFRCGAASGRSMQDVLPPSRHPSGSIYRWVGTGNWQQLPLLPQPILDLWLALLAPDNARNIPTGAFSPASINELSSAMNAVDPNCDRKTWIEMLMAMKRSEHPEGQEITRAWSKLSPKYPGDREFDKQWNSLRNDIPLGITPGTLFHHAMQAGWKREAPDVSELFKPIEQKPFEEVRNAVTPGSRLPELELELWPERLRNRAVEVAEQVGCDPTVSLLAGLAAISGAVDKRCTLRITETWNVPPTFWTMTIGEPADKKTPGSKPMFEPLRLLEIEDRDRYHAAHQMWQGQESGYAEDMKAYRTWCADASNATGNTQPPEVRQLPPEPQPKRILLNDATTQKVVALSEYRPQGFLLWLDEMNNWFGRVGNKGHTDDRGCWIQGYETGHYTMDRMGAGSIHVDNFALSIYGNCQPAVFREHAAQSATDGLLQRFMPVILNPEKNTMWKDGRPAFMSFRDDYEQLLRRTHGLPAFTYVFTPEANQLFRDFSEWALNLRADERLIQVSGSYNTALGKLEGNCARLCLLFHLIEQPLCPFVEGGTVERAIRLMRRFFYPMLRYTFLTVGQERDVFGDAVLDYLVQNATVRPTVSLSELRTVVRPLVGNRSSRSVDDALLVIMDDVIERGWAAVHVSHPRSPVFAINPALADHYKAERKQIILAKKRLSDQMFDSLDKKHGRPIERNVTATGYTPEMENS